jgi:hypothetical protein
MTVDSSGNTNTDTSQQQNSPQTTQQNNQPATQQVSTPSASFDLSSVVTAVNAIPEKIVAGLKESGHTQPPKETKTETTVDKPVEEKRTPGQQTNSNASAGDKFRKWWFG